MCVDVLISFCVSFQGLVFFFAAVFPLHFPHGDCWHVRMVLVSSVTLTLLGLMGLQLAILSCLVVQLVW